MAIHLPPLRERRDDILPLASHFLDLGRAAGVHATMSPALREAFLQHPWFGNVRELRNAIERMRLLNSDKLCYDLEDLDLVPLSETARSDVPVHGNPPARSADAVAHTRRIEDTAGTSDTVVPVSLDPWFMEGHSPARNLVRLRRLFREHDVLTRQEVMKALGISTGTATAYLKQLCNEGITIKVQPTRSPRSAYFRLNREQPAR